ncbi:MAG: metal-dependent hydrolase [Opitutales bacterium]
MDPLSQATFGAAAAALAAPKDRVRQALCVGLVAGAVPDLDVLIRSEEDPLLNLEFHRNVTHALFFAPFIGGLVALLFRGIFKWELRDILLPAILATLSHGILDACTSYGTQLYLPFSNYRESWDIISIIDPIFTLPLTLGILGALIIQKRILARFSFLWAIMYLSFGYIQRERAESYAAELAQSRGLTIDRLTARPSIANVLLWRIIVYSEGTYTVDAVNITPFKEAKIYEGTRVDSPDLTTYAEPGTRLAKDIARFDHFSQKYLYELPMESKTLLGDIRYSMLPNSIAPLWGIAFDSRHPEQHVDFIEFRDMSKAPLDEFKKMLRGEELSD